MKPPPRLLARQARNRFIYIGLAFHVSPAVARGFPNSGNVFKICVIQIIDHKSGAALDC